MIQKEEIENILKSHISDNDFYSNDIYCWFRIEDVTIKLTDLILASNKLNARDITIEYSVGRSLLIRIYRNPVSK